MILTYSKDIFVDLIKQGKKVHTIREDSGRRWKAGMLIQHWRGNPRNVNSNPYEFATGVCSYVEDIEIIRTDFEPDFIEHGIMVRVGKRWLSDGEIDFLIKRDGLSPRQFRMWFVPPGNEFFKGRIIHFENPEGLLRYEKFGEYNHFLLEDWAKTSPTYTVNGTTFYFNPLIISPSDGAQTK